MEDLIVIILTLIIGAIGALGHIKKKRAADQELNKLPRNPNDPMEEHHEYDHAFEPHQWEDEAQEEEIILEEETLHEAEGIKHPYHFKAEDEGGSVFQDDLTGSKELKLKEKIRKRTVGFSLRKAVIYSEILNRKYE